MANTGKYLALEQYLERNCNLKIKLSFEDIEKIISEPLPASARKYAAWWANNSEGHSHANSWLNAGAKVEEVKLGEFVVFLKSTIKTQESNQRVINIGKK